MKKFLLIYPNSRNFFGNEKKSNSVMDDDRVVIVQKTPLTKIVWSSN